MAATQEKAHIDPGALPADLAQQFPRGLGLQTDTNGKARVYEVSQAGVHNRVAGGGDVIVAGYGYEDMATELDRKLEKDYGQHEEVQKLAHLENKQFDTKAKMDEIEAMPDTDPGLWRFKRGVANRVLQASSAVRERRIKRAEKKIDKNPELDRDQSMLVMNPEPITDTSEKGMRKRLSSILGQSGERFKGLREKGTDLKEKGVALKDSVKEKGKEAKDRGVRGNLSLAAVEGSKAVNWATEKAGAGLQKAGTGLEWSKAKTQEAKEWLQDEDVPRKKKIAAVALGAGAVVVTGVTITAVAYGASKAAQYGLDQLDGGDGGSGGGRPRGNNAGSAAEQGVDQADTQGSGSHGTTPDTTPEHPGGGGGNSGGQAAEQGTNEAGTHGSGGGSQDAVGSSNQAENGIDAASLTPEQRDAIDSPEFTRMVRTGERIQANVDQQFSGLSPETRQQIADERLVNTLERAARAAEEAAKTKAA